MTDTATKLRETPIKPLFITYLIPSIIGMLLMGINIIVDGIFIAQALGPIALASVNIAAPVYAIFFSISLMMGIGGGTIYSISLGKQDLAYARRVFSQAVIFASASIICIAALCLWKIEKLALLFAANETVMPYVIDYLSIILTFGIIYVLENVLSNFIRNDGNPNLATIGLVVTSIVNIILNYLFLFIFSFGVRGAAYATILSATVGLFVLFAHFFQENRSLKFVFEGFQAKLLAEIIKTGFPSFITETSFAIMIWSYNLAFMRSVGEIGVASFAIVTHIHEVILLLFIGIGSALQPIASFHFGAKLWTRLDQILRISVKTTLVFGIIVLVIGMLNAKYLISIFGIQNPQLISFTLKGILLYFLAYLFLGYNILYASYFQSIGQSKKSMLITLIQGLLLLLPLLWLLPIWFSVSGIWLSLPVAQCLTSIIIFIINRHKHPVFYDSSSQHKQNTA